MSTAVFCHGCGTRRDALIVNDELACTSCNGAFVEILGAEAEAVGPAPAPMPALFVGGMAMPRIYIHRAAGLDDTMMMQVMSGLFQQPQQQAPLDPTQDAAQQPPQAQQQQQQNGQPPQQEQLMGPQSLAAMLRVITTQVMQEAAALQVRHLILTSLSSRRSLYTTLHLTPFPSRPPFRLNQTTPPPQTPPQQQQEQQ